MTSFGVVLTQELDVLAILKGPTQSLDRLESGREKVLDQQFSHFVVPYFSTINDWSKKLTV